MLSVRLQYFKAGFVCRQFVWDRSRCVLLRGLESVGLLARVNSWAFSQSGLVIHSNRSLVSAAMLQVDVFWSFAMGASLATLAGENLKREGSMVVNRYFVFTVCYLSMIFSPTSVYFLWQHTGWESMFFFGFEDLHGLFPCLFTLSNVLLGVIGFVLCAQLVRNNMETTAHACWTSTYAVTFAIATFGYDRFLYAGTLDEWRRGVKYDLSDFFKTQVFYTMSVMGIFVFSPLLYAMWKCPSGPHMNYKARSELLKVSVLQYIRVSGLIISTYLLLFFIPKLLPQWRILPEHWHVDRLFAFLVGQSLFGVVIFLPIYLVQVTTTSNHQTKKK